jgi:hypothetical protein
LQHVPHLALFTRVELLADVHARHVFLWRAHAAERA